MIDLQLGRDFIESFMEDSCIVRRDYQGVEDDVLDEDTGLLIRPVADTVAVYSGKCRIAPVRPQQELQDEQGEHPISLRIYKMLVPMSVTDIRFDDRVEITYVHNDLSLVGKVMRVIDTVSRTHGVYRRVNMVDTSDPNQEALDER